MAVRSWPILLKKSDWRAALADLWNEMPPTLPTEAGQATFDSQWCLTGIPFHHDLVKFSGLALGGLFQQYRPSADMFRQLVGNWVARLFSRFLVAQHQPRCELFRPAPELHLLARFAQHLTVIEAVASSASISGLIWAKCSIAASMSRVYCISPARLIEQTGNTCTMPAHSD